MRIPYSCEWSLIFLDHSMESTSDIQKNQGDTEKRGDTLAETVQQHSQKISQSAEDARNQLVTYGNQIREYLNSIQADVENYKFSVEKTKDGIAVDVAFRATVQEHQ